MSDCLLSLVFDEPLDCYDKLSLPLRQGNRIMRFSPFNTFPALDGRVVIGAATRQDWIALLDVMGRGDLLDSAEYMDPGWRVANNARVDSLVAARTCLRPVNEIIDLLDARDIPCSRIRSVSDVMTWSHIHGRGMLSTLKHPGYPHLDGPLAPAFPIKFTAADTGYDEPAALHGQHNDEIYRGVLAMSDAEIGSLLEKGVI
jgi:crotonobetainyl-CoA:carnitine CoA-transferase CaiB-like acyl-CoA transferase